MHQSAAGVAHGYRLVFTASLAPSKAVLDALSLPFAPVPVHELLLPDDKRACTLLYVCECECAMSGRNAVLTALATDLQTLLHCCQ